MNTSTLTLRAGHCVTVEYTDLNSRYHSLDINAAGQVLIVEHIQSEAAMIIRPSVGVQFLLPATEYK